MAIRETERVVEVHVTVRDRQDMYNSSQRGTATRTFPADEAPAIIAGWAGRTAIAQLRDAEASYPLPKPEQSAPDPAVRLEAIATAPDDAAAAAAAGDTDDLPF